MVLERKILAPADLRAWSNSAAYADILSFIESVSKAITSKPIKKDSTYSKEVASVCELLDRLQKKIDAFPPETQAQRFGNRAFRSWFAWLESNAAQLCNELFGTHLVDSEGSIEAHLQDGLAEAAQYLVESVGNSIRIDYGTGHELAFIAFLVCLFKIGVLKSPPPGTRSPTGDLAGVGLAVMPAYLALVRRLQLTYRMEPAGSHGVWCLDDFQFVPFIWGSSQLIGSGEYEPKSIPDAQIAAHEQEKYLFFSCINFIYQVKTGPFEEHSNTLYGISQVPYWEKVHSGLIKMYKGEVLNKFPVVQHFLLGRLLSFDPAPNTPGQRIRPAFGPKHPVGGADPDRLFMPPPPPVASQLPLHSNASAAVTDSDQTSSVTSS